MPGPLSPLGLPQSPLSSLLAQSALSGFPPMDMPPTMLQSLLAQSAAMTGGLSPADMFPSPFSPVLPPSPFSPFSPASPFAPGVAPPMSGPLSPAPTNPSSATTPGFQPTPAATPTPNLIPPGLASLYSPQALSSLLSPMNPFMNRDPYMGDSLTPMFPDIASMQYAQAFPNPFFFPRTRSATENT